MSLGNFFQKIWDGIKHVFDGLPNDLKKAVHIGVLVTENIKKFTDSGTADVLTALIPTEVDDTIKNKLREFLPKILSELKLADKCGALTDPNEITKCAIETLQQIEGDFKSAFLHDLSILVAQVASDGKLDWKDGVSILQWYYTHKFKAQEETAEPEVKVVVTPQAESIVKQDS
jgi:hypothetical protein